MLQMGKMYLLRSPGTFGLQLTPFLSRVQVDISVPGVFMTLQGHYPKLYWLLHFESLVKCKMYPKSTPVKGVDCQIFKGHRESPGISLRKVIKVGSVLHQGA